MKNNYFNKFYNESLIFTVPHECKRKVLLSFQILHISSVFPSAYTFVFSSVCLFVTYLSVHLRVCLSILLDKLRVKSASHYIKFYDEYLDLLNYWFKSAHYKWQLNFVTEKYFNNIHLENVVKYNNFYSNPCFDIHDKWNISTTTIYV